MSTYFDEGESQKSTEESSSFFNKINIYSNAIKDKLIKYRKERWIIVFILLIIYIIRIFITKGYYALTYCMGIHFLNSFIGFISPLDDPEENLNEENSFLPIRNNEEFKPFYRKLKEYQFWSGYFWILLIGIILTFFEGFDIPVFWPLLLVYFLFIFILTMRHQIAHMIKYHYLPWDSGKKTYNPK